MLFLKSKAKKNQEIQSKIDCAVEYALANEKKIQEIKSELDEYKQKYKVGMKFKYLELNVLLNSVYQDIHFRTDPLRVSISYIKDGEIVDTNISLELFESLLLGVYND